MATSDSVKQAVEQNIAAVESAYRDSLAKWADAGGALASPLGLLGSAGVWLQSTLVDDAPRAAALKALRDMHDKFLTGWLNRGRALLPSDQAGLSKWVEQGRGYIKDFRDVGGYSGDADLINITAATVAATAKEVKDDIGGALVFWGKYGKQIIIGAVVLLAAYKLWPVVRALRNT